MVGFDHGQVFLIDYQVFYPNFFTSVYYANYNQNMKCRCFFIRFFFLQLPTYEEYNSISLTFLNNVSETSTYLYLNNIRFDNLGKEKKLKITQR